jgi:hypothetical protein
MTEKRESAPAASGWSAPGTVTAYAAADVAFGYALMSLYWALGGHALVSTIGGYVEQFARRGGALPVLIALAATLAKVAGGLLALALVRPWGRMVPRGWLLGGCAGVFCSLAEQGWIHSVPVHFLHPDGEIRICCRTSSVKAANVDRSRRGTLCVAVANGPERRYMTVEGPARVERPANARDLAALDEKYSRADTAGWAEANYAGEAAVVITPARWIAWSDWD